MDVHASLEREYKMDGRSGDGWMLMACLRENKQSGWMNGRMDANAILKRG